MVRLLKTMLGFGVIAAVIAGVACALLYLPITLSRNQVGRDRFDGFLGILLLELFAILVFMYMSNFAFKIGDDIIQKIKKIW